MAAFPEDFHAAVQRCSESGLSAQIRGQRLEDVVAEAFTAVPGVEVRARNALSVFENEELDLVMINRAVPDGLPLVGSYFSVECKNWSRPVGSAEVSWFATKLRRSNQRLGVLVAATGITGTAAGLMAAQFEAASALAEGQRVVVLTLDEMTWLSSGEELADLLTEKEAKLIARREIYIASEPPAGAPLTARGRALVTRQERDERLARIADDAATDPADEPSLTSAMAAYRTAFDEFMCLEDNEPSDERQFDEWNAQNMDAFTQLEQRMRALAQACICALRAQRGSDWTVERLAWLLDSATPTNLDAPPDSELAALLTDYWMRTATGTPEYMKTSALACLLSWALEWLLNLEIGSWPPSMV